MDKLIPSFSVENAISFFKKNIRSFKTESEDFSHILKSDDLEKFSLVKKIGEASLDGSGDLLVFTAKFNGDLSERTSKKIQFEIAKKILKNDFKDGAIFIFYDKTGNFRFSFIRINYGDKENKHTNWKRYTYFVDKEKTNKTFKDRIGNCTFSSLDEIQEAFSVEKLNKEFYQNIAKAFYSLIGGKIKINSKEEDYKLTLKLPSVSDTDKSVHQKFAVRLVGRTIFCWFLKNKVSANGLPLLPQGWLSSKVVVEVNNNQHNYYHAILEKLFFEVLNKRIENRPTNLPSGHENIPYLNGGLFEAVYDDFYEVDKNSGITKHLNTLIIPNKWFSEFFEVLERYNFTIDENTINDSEVSIDPEMLGTIFENLLAEIDPDTEKSARKSTGSFYTPREIVDYMVEQSLIQYLKTKTQIEDEDKLKSLFVDDSEYTFTVKETDDILKAISEVKILDPACGSGAFPMGALHKIVKLLQKLDKGAVWWKAKQKENAARVLDSKYLNDFNEKIDNSNSDYARKLGVIQHSIYGVDIQPIAAEISKLRSFLSLIIDENIDDNAPNRGIEPLPNLEFKFVTANTLISLDEGKKGGMMTFDFGETTELQNQLQQLRNTYLQASPQEKENLKQQFEQLQTQIYKNELKAGGQNKRAQQLAAWKPFSNESSSWFDPDWMFGVEKFDVVIGNPPYVQLREVKKELIDIYKKCKYHKDAEGGRLNLFQYFISLMLDLTKDKMITSFIVQNSLMAEETTKNIRKILLNKNKIITIDSFPERDNPKKRVFEGVKMSVCVGLVSKNFIKEDYFFDLNIWEEKHMINLHSLRYSKNQLNNFFGESLIFPLALPSQRKILEKVFSVSNKLEYNIFSGEVDMTKYKPFFNENKKDLRIIHGAQILKYYITDKPSQGIVNYININDIKENTRFSHKDNPRIVMQRITGVDSNIRLIMNLINDKYLCANSTNYIPEQKHFNLHYLLGVLNSNLINFVYKLFSTNTNITSTDLKKIPIISEDDKISFSIIENVSNILKNKLQNLDTTALENEIDIMVYKLYELTYDEVLVVDPEFSLSEEEYNNYVY
jgi:hypothetical protein